MRESKKSEYDDGKFEYASTSRVVNTLAEKKASKFPLRIEVDFD